MWWYQCRKMSFCLRRTMKMVSTSSSNFEKPKRNPHMPGWNHRKGIPSPTTSGLVSMHMVVCQPFVKPMLSNTGAMGWEGKGRGRHQMRWRDEDERMSICNVAVLLQYTQCVCVFFDVLRLDNVLSMEVWIYQPAVEFTKEEVVLLEVSIEWELEQREESLTQLSHLWWPFHLLLPTLRNAQVCKMILDESSSSYVLSVVHTSGMCTISSIYLRL